MTCHAPIDNPFNSTASIYPALFDYLLTFSIVLRTIKDLGSFWIVIFVFTIFILDLSSLLLPHHREKGSHFLTKVSTTISNETPQTFGVSQ